MAGRSHASDAETCRGARNHVRYATVGGIAAIEPKIAMPDHVQPAPVRVLEERERRRHERGEQGRPGNASEARNDERASLRDDRAQPEPRGHSKTTEYAREFRPGTLHKAAAHKQSYATERRTTAVRRREVSSRSSSVGRASSEVRSGSV